MAKGQPKVTVRVCYAATIGNGELKLYISAMATYTAVATNPQGELFVLGPIDAPDDQQALLDFGELVRQQLSLLRSDAQVVLLRRDGSEVCSPSAVSEHVKRESH
jgi:hypothetical protein